MIQSLLTAIYSLMLIFCKLHTDKCSQEKNIAKMTVNYYWH